MRQDQHDALIDQAFTYYRKAGFPFPKLRPHELLAEFYKLQESRANINEPQQVLFTELKTTEIEIESTGTAIANHFHSHIFSSHAFRMRSAVESFLIDKSLRKAIRLALETTGKITDVSVLNKLKIVNGTQVCSNFRPAAAKAVYEKYLSGKRVLDPSTGYGGRLLGFLALDREAEYVGIDPAIKPSRLVLPMQAWLISLDSLTRSSSFASLLRMLRFQAPFSWLSHHHLISKRKYTLMSQLRAVTGIRTLRAGSEDSGRSPLRRWLTALSLVVFSLSTFRMSRLVSSTFLL